MSTSHTHCLLYLKPYQENCDMHICNNNLIYIRLFWQRCVSVASIAHVQTLDICAYIRAPLLLWPQLQTGQPELPLLFLYCLTQVFFFFFLVPGPPAVWLAQTLHTDCKSFTSCQERAGLEGGGWAGRTVPHQPRWGECRPFMRGLGGLTTNCLQHLKNSSLMSFPLAIWCQTFTVILTFRIVY